MYAKYTSETTQDCTVHLLLTFVTTEICPTQSPTQTQNDFKLMILNTLQSNKFVHNFQE